MNMNKINFTKEHESELKMLIADSVLNKRIYSGPMGQEYNIFDLINGLSITSLRTISQTIQNRISKLSISDEWIDNPNAELITTLETDKRLISLVIGWKLYNQALAENAKERERLTKQLDELVRSTKTPADLIAELQAKINELE